MLVFVTLDEYQNRKLLTDGQIQELRDYSELVEKWLDENIAEDVDWYRLYSEILMNKNPVLAYLFHMYVKQKKSIWKNKLEQVVDRLKEKQGFICIVIGERRRGKTTLAYILAKILKEKYNEKIWWFGPPADLPFGLVDGSTLDFFKIPENTTSILDDASVKFYSRLSLTREQVSITRQIPLISQNRRNFFVITQTPELLDINFIRQSNALIFTSQFYLPMRKQRLIINEELNYFMPKEVGEALYYDNSTLLELNFSRPDWWRDEYSNPYRKFRSDYEAYRFVLKILEDVAEPRLLQEYLGMRAYHIDEDQIRYIQMLAEDLGLDYLLSLSEEKLLKLIKEGMNDTPLQDLITKKSSDKKYEFMQTPILQAIWKTKFERDKNLLLMSKRNFNRKFLEELKLRVLKGKNVIISIIGPTGTWKSTSAMGISEAIAFLIKKAFEAENIHFMIEDLLEDIGRVKEKDTLIKDEQIDVWGIGSGRQEMELKNVEETTRKLGINIIYCSPTLRVHVHHFVLETFAADEKNKVTKLLIRTPDGIPLGYITVRWASPKLWEKYEKRKNAFLAKVTTRQTSSKSYLEEKAMELLNDPDMALVKNQETRLALIRKKYSVGTEEAKEIRAWYTFLFAKKRQEEELTAESDFSE